MKRILVGFIKVMGVLLVVLLIAAFCCFKLLNKVPYKETVFYKEELEALKNVPHGDAGNTDTIQIGWSRENLLPSFTTPIAIDAKRGGKHFDGVHDSIYVRAFVFKQGNKKIAYVSADLLIIPPTVTRLFDSILVKEGFDNNNIYFTATHSQT